MTIEQGIVIEAHGPAPATARVKTIQTSACKSCASKNGCHSDGSGREVDAINVVNARTGDRIQLSMATGALLKATFLLYLFPILGMLAGAIAGAALAPYLGLDTSLTSAAAAIISFAATMLLVRRRAGAMALKKEYRPKITRILSRSQAKASQALRPHSM